MSAVHSPVSRRRWWSGRVPAALARVCRYQKYPGWHCPTFRGVWAARQRSLPVRCQGRMLPKSDLPATHAKRQGGVPLNCSRFLAFRGHDSGRTKSKRFDNAPSRCALQSAGPHFRLRIPAAPLYSAPCRQRKLTKLAHLARLGLTADENKKFGAPRTGPRLHRETSRSRCRRSKPHRPRRPHVNVTRTDEVQPLRSQRRRSPQRAGARA